MPMTTDAPPRPPHPVSPGQLEWLGHELTAWRAEGLLADEQAAAILARYRASRRFSIGRLLLTLGGAFDVLAQGDEELTLVEGGFEGAHVAT